MKTTILVPYGLKVSISLERDDVNQCNWITVHAPLYINKEWKLSFCYSYDFSLGDILKDHNFQTVMLKSYGV